MFRVDFLRALAGLGVGVAAPKVLKDEENHVITSEDGRTAWDQDGLQVYQERYDFSAEAWNSGNAGAPYNGLVNTDYITYDIPTHTLIKGNRRYYPGNAVSGYRWTPKS